MYNLSEYTWITISLRAECDTDLCLVVASYRKMGSKQTAQKFDVERFNLRKLW
jgi:hypothetical protein